MHAHVAAAETLTTPPDLVLVCTKAQDAEAAIAANAALIDGVPVVVVQNGLDGVATAARLLPRVVVHGPAVDHRRQLHRARRRAGHDARRRATSGAATARPTTSAVGWPRVLSEAVPVIAIDGFRGAQWTKLVVNMLNAVPAIVGRERAGRRRRSPPAPRGHRRRCARRCGSASPAASASARCRASATGGCASSPGCRSRRAGAAAGSMRVRMGGVPNLGSTQQSLRRGQPTEIDFLNGVVVREAAAVGPRRAGERGAHRARARGRGVAASSCRRRACSTRSRSTATGRAVP